MAFLLWMVPVRNGTWHGSSGKYYYDISLQIKGTKDETNFLHPVDVNESVVVVIYTPS